MDDGTKVKVQWIKNWHEVFGKEKVPKDYEGDGEKEGRLDAAYSHLTNTIYAIKGKASPFEIEHERYHAIQAHKKTGKEPLEQTPEEYVEEELRASKYAYNKTKTKETMRPYFGGIVSGLTEKYFKLSKPEARELIHKTIKSINPPKYWIETDEGFKTLESMHHLEEAGYKISKHRVSPKTPRKIIKRKPKVKRKRNPSDRYYLNYNLDGKTYD